MLRSLVQASLRFRVLVVAAAAGLIIFGVATALRSPLDAFPEFAPPLVEVQTEAPGMSSEAVETIVTIPLESALTGLPRMTRLRSKSVQGLSSIMMDFQMGTDVFAVRQMVTERVSVVAAKLSRQVLPPRLMPPLSSTSRVLKVGLTPKSKDKLQPGEAVLSPMEVSVLYKWVIEPRLRAIPGVANTSTYGLHDKQYQILVKPADLRAHGVTLAQVKQAAAQAVVHGSAGFHDTPNQRLAIQYLTRVQRPEDLGNTVIRPAAPLASTVGDGKSTGPSSGEGKGRPLLLGQVAEIVTGTPPDIGEGIVNGQPGPLVVVEKFPWANTLEVTREVERVLEELKPSLVGVEITTGIFRPATFIELALANLRTALILGCLLVALILFAFLMEWRTAVISLTAIPLSLVSAVLALNWLGGTLNTMVLAGLAIAIGEVVDDAIIDVENIVRRLRQNRQAGSPQANFQVVLGASLEVRGAVVYASFIVVFVCLPIFFMSGVAGAFFRPLALAYILSVLASLGVALTVTPALALMLLPKAVECRGESALTRGVRAVYRKALPFAMNRPALGLGMLGLLLAGVAVIYPLLKEEYLPRFQETDFLMHWVAKPGTSIEAVSRDIQRVSGELTSETPVKEFGAHIARAEIGEEVVGPNFAELWVSLGHFDGDYVDARRQIERVLARHPGFEHDLLTYLQERIKEVLTGSGASIVLRIYGPDLAKLRAKADKVRQAIEGGEGQGRIPGVIDLKVEPQALVPQLELLLDLNKSATYGLTPGAVVDHVTTLLNGVKVGEVHQDQMIFDVMVWGHPDVRRALPSLRRLEIDLPHGGGTVPLEALADLRLVHAVNTIRHYNGFRCIDVTCNVSGQDLGGVVREIRRRVDPLREKDYAIDYLGEYKARSENQRQLLGIGLVSLLAIAVLLYLDFQSLRLTLLVMGTLPFALVGGVAAAYVSGGVLSLGSLVGFITVLGIASRNGIMLISHYQHLQAEEGVPFGRELILRGSVERIAPILMTGVGAGLGLLPLAISGNKPGYEVEFPMAVVILGGLVTSTLLNLFILPTLYEKFAPREWHALSPRRACCQRPPP